MPTASPAIRSPFLRKREEASQEVGLVAAEPGPLSAMVPSRRLMMLEPSVAWMMPAALTEQPSALVPSFFPAGRSAEASSACMRVILPAA